MYKKSFILSALLATASMASGVSTLRGRWAQADAAAPAPVEQPAEAGAIKADWWEADNGAKRQVSEDGKSVTLAIKPGAEGEKINSKQVRRKSY